MKLDRIMVAKMYRAHLGVAQRYLTGQFLDESFDDVTALNELDKFNYPLSLHDVFYSTKDNHKEEALCSNFDDLSKFWRTFFRLKWMLLTEHKKLLEMDFPELNEN